MISRHFMLNMKRLLCFNLIHSFIFFFSYRFCTFDHPFWLFQALNGYRKRETKKKKRIKLIVHAASYDYMSMTIWYIHTHKNLVNHNGNDFVTNVFIFIAKHSYTHTHIQPQHRLNTAYKVWMTIYTLRIVKLCQTILVH